MGCLLACRDTTVRTHLLFDDMPHGNTHGHLHTPAEVLARQTQGIPPYGRRPHTARLDTRCRNIPRLPEPATWTNCSRSGDNLRPRNRIHQRFRKEYDLGKRRQDVRADSIVAQRPVADLRADYRGLHRGIPLGAHRLQHSLPRRHSAWPSGGVLTTAHGHQHRPLHQLLQLRACVQVALH